MQRCDAKKSQMAYEAVGTVRRMRNSEEPRDVLGEICFHQRKSSRSLALNSQGALSEA